MNDDLDGFVPTVVHPGDPDVCPHGSTTGPLCHRCSAAKRALEAFGAPDLRDALEAVLEVNEEYNTRGILGRPIPSMDDPDEEEHIYLGDVIRDALDAAGVEP